MDKHAMRVLEYHKIIETIAGLTISKPGYDMAKIMTPSNDRNKVIRWMDETSEGEEYILKQGSTPIDGFTDLDLILKRSRVGGILSLSELRKVGFALRAAASAKSRIGNFGEDESLLMLKSYADRLEPNTPTREEIDRCIESDDQISDYASTELGNIRRRMRQVNDAVREKLNSMIRSASYQKYLQEFLITTRNDRFVLPVKQEYKGQVQGIIHDQSSSGATLFIEPMAVVQLNNKLREMELAESKEIEKILAILSGMVETGSGDIEYNQKILVKLDVIFAKAKYSKQIRGIRPNILNERRIIINKGRHPLLKADEVIPIDLYIGDEFTALVVTGPNTGGKTVTIKTAGIFALMAQSGLHLPANEGTSIGVFSDVFADIGDEQSIEQSLSTFSSHMTNIVHILDNLNSGALVLFDELGAGTDPTEGAALAMAILEHMCRRKIVTMATTHYSELKAYALTRNGMENAAMEFNIASLEPTYKLLIGIPGKSNAFEISKKLGLQDEFIELAKEFLSTEDVRLEDLMTDLENSHIAASNDREETQKELSEAKMLRKKVEETRDKLEKKRETAIEKSKMEARRILYSAKEEAAAIIKELNDLRKKGLVEGRDIEGLRGRLNANIREAETATRGIRKVSKNKNQNSTIKSGDTVKMVSLNKTGYIIDGPDAKGNVTVQAGILKLNMKIDQLVKVSDDSIETEPSKKRKKQINLRVASISSKIDVRGRSSDEAIMEIDTYLDEVFLAGLEEVTIVHGKGTGVLRQKIGSYLRHHPHVKNHRIGVYGEGEGGVTIVTIK